MENNDAFEINVDDNTICFPCSYHNQMYRQYFKKENIDDILRLSRVEYLITYAVGIAAELGDLEEEEKPGLLRLKDKHIASNSTIQVTCFKK
jgi:hypothetical protein